MCCEGCDVYDQTEEGMWGIENDNWCGIKDSCFKTEPTPEGIFFFKLFRIYKNCLLIDKYLLNYKLKN